MWRPLPLELPAGTRPLKVLVTGYGPFMGYETNPSGELAKAVGAFDRLFLDGRVPPTIKQEDIVCALQIQTKPPDPEVEE